MEMDWVSFAGSILSGLIGGLFTFLGVKATINHEKKKIKNEENRKVLESMPRLEFAKKYVLDELKEPVKNCEIVIANIKEFKEVDGIARFIYDDNLLDGDKLEFIDVLLENTGKTEIENIFIASNPRYESAFDLKTKDFFVERKILSCGAYVGQRFIKPGEFVRVRIHFLENENIRTALSVWIIDINGRYWRQSLNINRKEIEKPELKSRRDFKEMTDESNFVECYKKPYLW